MDWVNFFQDLAEHPEKARMYIALGAAGIFFVFVLIYGVKIVLSS